MSGTQITLIATAAIIAILGTIITYRDFTGVSNASKRTNNRTILLVMDISVTVILTVLTIAFYIYVYG